MKYLPWQQETWRQSRQKTKKTGVRSGGGGTASSTTSDVWSSFRLRSSSAGPHSLYFCISSIALIMLQMDHTNAQQSLHSFACDISTEATLRVDFQTDFFPAETSWNVTKVVDKGDAEKSSQEVVLSSISERGCNIGQELHN